MPGDRQRRRRHRDFRGGERGRRRLGCRSQFQGGGFAYGFVVPRRVAGAVEPGPVTDGPLVRAGLLGFVRGRNGSPLVASVDFAAAAQLDHVGGVGVQVAPGAAASERVLPGGVGAACQRDQRIPGRVVTVGRRRVERHGQGLA